MINKLSEIQVSIVIPMLNEEKYIGRCLMSLVDQDWEGLPLEIIVVNGLSKDRSHEIVEGFKSNFSLLKIIENPRRITPISLNMGVKASTGEVIIILGAHSYVAKDFVSKNLYYLNTMVVDCVGGSIAPIGDTYQGESIALAMSSPLGVGNAFYRYSKVQRLVDTVQFGAYRRDIFQKVGFFDEDLVRNQDFELNHRIVSTGGRILLAPEVHGYYVVRSSIPKLFKQYFDYGFWKTKVILKEVSAFRLRYQIPPIFIVSLGITGIIGLFSNPFFILFKSILFLYGGLVLLISLKLSLNNGIKYIPILPFAFMTLHFGFGLGLITSWFQRIFSK
ncbi:MAG: succinoglycan biosynthesis protein exoa [Candidatus Marinimicrobia bacterium]|nr:succinoglycan biosynthesis protein exoa [Candidatus Neomarinimicrobiota bacterium]MBF89407.1 succinoglycan biosynthesis protein exoa [Candidatus Neomarinimicrobiota bacterium]|tara:strand:+ start:6358 stop:7356 length:999 start_codon:yes stop_codon:yes gene_type:complete